MFSLERLLISFSAFIGDSVSKTPKRHVLLCLLTFGLLAIGILLVEIEHDVFKLWVRIFIIFFFSFGRDIFFFSLFLGENLVSVFCSVLGGSLRGSKERRRRRRRRRKTNRCGREREKRALDSLLLFSLLLLLLQNSAFFVKFCLFSFPPSSSSSSSLTDLTLFSLLSSFS